MNKKLIEYLIIAIAIILLLYSAYALITYQSEGFSEIKDEITDTVTMYYPSSSAYTVAGDNIEFRNELYDFYNLDVSKLSSSDKRLSNLLTNFAKVSKGTIDYKNETCYLLTMELEEDNGYRYHSMIIPIDSFDKESLSFNKKANVYVFDGNDRDFVIYSAYNSQVVI